MPVKLVQYDRRYLLASRRWLRDPEIASLTMTPPFTDHEQESWFLSLQSKADYAVWGVELDGAPVGVAGLKNITLERAEYFGYLGEKWAWGAGHGTQMLLSTIDEARARGCRQIWLRVWRENQRAIALYRRQGFEVTRDEGDELHMTHHV
jgi:RimJ/RimL family protein N-acetyltransferase